jgi:hypothetical protein
MNEMYLSLKGLVSHHGIAGFCFYLTQNQHGKNTISNKNQIKEEKILKGCMVQIYTVRTTDYKKRFQIYGSTLPIKWSPAVHRSTTSIYLGTGNF